MVNPSKTLEVGMEEQVESHLVEVNGFISHENRHFDSELCLDSNLVLDFIKTTQIEEWTKYTEIHGSESEDKFLNRINNEIRDRGILEVIKNGLKSYGSDFDLYYRMPVSGMNPSSGKLYKNNIWSVIRQVHYSSRTPNKSVDMVIFINGLPIITIEFKDRLSGSGYTFEDAINQYKRDRDPNELLFSFKRCFVHFAVDDCQAYMTTKLNAENTVFIPFNKGKEDGAGNPDTEGYRTEYLWQEIFTKELLSEIIQDFLKLEDIFDDNGKLTGEQKLIFPRYHQLNAVKKCISSALEIGSGKNYLIQHSAGSGKSNTIAWLAHKLFSLHDSNDNKIFDSVFVITDRIVLDRQMQRKLGEFEDVSGVVTKIEKGSKQLMKDMENGKKIFVTTIQKFPHVVDKIQKIPSSTFAVLIDEAHSSQAGEHSKDLKKTLIYANLDEAERDNMDEWTWEDEMTKEMEARGPLKNVSFFAFTATPKHKTFQLFGEIQPDGSYKSFDLYSMRQAIEEGFILDVLMNYTTYKTCFRLLKTIKNNPNYDKRKVIALLRAYVDFHELTITKKIEIMIEHFHAHVVNKIPDNNGVGHAKAMIVTRSQLHAVRYKKAVDKYLREKNYDYKALVAFSGTIIDPEDGLEYTEYFMNGFSETQTADEFKKDENKFLIVVEKFQTGFDQPLLYAMYVDKKLSGINAVQTLSRLNRVYPNKDGTIVLDFANSTEEIENAFKDFYVETILSEGTDPDKLYDIQRKLENFYVYTKDDVYEFAKLYFDSNVKQDKLHPILNKVASIYTQLPEEDQDEFKGLLKDFNRLYSFISQVMPFKDEDLEKLHVFGLYLYRKLPDKKERLPVEVIEQIDLGALRIQRIHEGNIDIGQSEPLKPPEYDGKTHLPIIDKKPLSEILNFLNNKYGNIFSEKELKTIHYLEKLISSNEAFLKTIKVNPKEKVKLSYEDVFEIALQDIMEEDFEFYRKINGDERVKIDLMNLIFENIYIKLGVT